MFDSFVKLIALRSHFVTRGAFTKSFDRVMAHPCLDGRLLDLVKEQHFFDLLFKQLKLSSSFDLAFVILIDSEVLKSTFLSSKDTVEIASGTECFQLYRFDLGFKVIYFVACGSN